MKDIKISAYKGPHTSYAEVGQTNPLRFVCLYKDGDSFSEQSKEFKCKDFFNEIVAKYHGHLLGCYGFTADSIKTNDEGVWVELRHIVNQEVYQANIKLVNALIARDGLPQLELLPYKKGFVCLLPRQFFSDTYLVSLLTYLMRVSNVGEVVADATFMEHPTKPIDNPFSGVYAKVIKRGFKTPENPANSYYYYGKDHDYKKVPQVYNVHNCGVNQWTSMLMAEGLYKEVA